MQEEQNRYVHQGNVYKVCGPYYSSPQRTSILNISLHLHRHLHPLHLPHHHAPQVRLRSSSSPLRRPSALRVFFVPLFVVGIFRPGVGSEQGERGGGEGGELLPDVRAADASEDVALFDMRRVRGRIRPPLHIRGEVHRAGEHGSVQVVLVHRVWDDDLRVGFVGADKGENGEQLIFKQAQLFKLFKSINFPGI